MKKIFITGANGFVGKNLIQALENKNIPFIAGDRKYYGDLITQNNWRLLLEDVDVVVHLAARVHVMNESEKDPLISFRKMNTDATVQLAQAAKALGVKRFIFISSVKVNGEQTFDRPYSASDSPMPQDPYGISKMEAEAALLQIHEPGVFEIVIIRPPLIYGNGVKANFEKLFWMVKKDLPIPFGLVKNKRSLVSVFNLCDLIIECFNHPKAGGEIFLVSDDYDYSLRDIVIMMGKVEKKTPHLIPIPVNLMQFGAKLLGKNAYAVRLFGNLHVDITKTKTLLNWKPKFGFEETLKK